LVVITARTLDRLIQGLILIFIIESRTFLIGSLVSSSLDFLIHIIHAVVKLVVDLFVDALKSRIVLVATPVRELAPLSVLASKCQNDLIYQRADVGFCVVRRRVLTKTLPYRLFYSVLQGPAGIVSTPVH